MKRSHRTLLFITLFTLGIASLVTVARSQDSAYLLIWYTFQSGNYIQSANEDSNTSYTLHSAIGPPSAAQSSDGAHLLYSGVAMPAATAVPTPTPSFTSTSTDTPTPTHTLTHTPTDTPTPTHTLTQMPTDTSTPEDTPTGTFIPPTVTPTHTPTDTSMPEETPTNTPTETSLPSTVTPTHISSHTSVPPPTLTQQPQATYTLLPTYTPFPTSTLPPTATPTDIPTDTPTIAPTSTSAVTCYQLTINQRGIGQLPSPSPNRSIGCPLQNYIEDQFITLSAEPEPGWKVEGWKGTDQTNINTFTMPAADHAVEVTYYNTQLDSNCRSLTPPGDPLPASCLVGIVYLDDRPMGGIDVQITNQAGESITVPAEIKQNSNDPRPHYRIALDDPKFRIQTGESITIHVTHGDREANISWVVQSDHQQVDISLPPVDLLPEECGPPIGTINSISTENGILTAIGAGHTYPQCREIISYLWRSNRHEDNILGEGATLTIPVTDLQTGHHQLRFQAKDSQGTWSEPIIADIYVNHESSAEWVMLLYLAGDYDDEDLQWDRFKGVLDKLKLIDNPALRIVAQIDGYEKQTERWIIEPGQEAVQDSEFSGEVAMNDPQTLIDFLKWGQAKFPSDHYYLAIADHGQAVRGIAWDHTSSLIDKGAPDDSAYMTVKGLGEALNTSDIAPIDVLHLDACSMNLIEVAYEIGEGAEVMVSSQYLGWDYFAYDRYAEQMTGNTTPTELGTQIVETYANLVEGDSYAYTISALDMKRLPVISTLIDELAAALNKIDKDILQAVRSRSQTFDSQGDLENDEYDLYLDLKSWVTNVMEAVDDDEVQKKVEAILKELDVFIIVSKANSGLVRTVNADLTEAAGLSIFYPRSRFYASHKQYIDGDLFKFSQESRWKELLSNSVGVVQSDDPLTPVPSPFPQGPVGTETPTSHPTGTPISTETPTGTPTATLISTSTLAPTPTLTITPTPTLTITPTPTLTITPTPTPTSLQQYLPLVNNQS